MKHFKVLVSVSALLFGASLVGISLVSASQVQSRGLDVTQKELYFEDTVLPDHALYPALMVKDRVMLELAQPTNRIEMRVQYAQERMHAAELLYEKGKPDLALSTATKAQKYLLTAALEAKSMELDRQALEFVLEALREQTDHLEQLQQKYPGEQQVVLQKLIQESLAHLE